MSSTSRHRLFFTSIVESKVFRGFILALILFSIAIMMAITMPAFSPSTKSYLEIFDLAIILVFSLELILRLMAARETNPEKSAESIFMSFFGNPLNIIDLVVILSFLFHSLLYFDAVVLRIFRLVRIIALVFKTSRFSRALQTLARVLRKKSGDLLVTLVLVLTLLLISATLMYYVEGEAQPEAFSSIPETMWWAVATLTTVGYGDVYPVTAAGRLIAAFIAVLGIGLFALPAGILGSGYLECRQRDTDDDTCPHCGKKTE